MGQHKFFQINVFTLKLCALYPILSSYSTPRKCIVRIWKIINIIIYCTMGSFLVFGAVDSLKEGLLASSENIYETWSFIITPCLINFYHVYGKQLHALIEDLNERFVLKADSIIGDVNMDGVGKRCKQISFVVLGLSGFITMATALTPLFNNFKFPLATPLKQDTTNTGIYVVLYILETYVTFLNSIIVTGGDAFFASMVMLTAQQYEILSVNLHNCVYNALLDYGVPKVDILFFKKAFDEDNLETGDADKKIKFNQIFKIINLKDFNQILLKRFKQYIIHHQDILSITARIQDTFLLYLMIRAGGSLFYPLFSVFVVTTTKDTVLAITFLHYSLFAISINLGISAAGQGLISKGKKVSTMLYNSPWYYICNKKFKANMRFVLFQSTRPVKISILGLYDVSFTTFLLLLNSSYTYFLVLKHVTN